jgi:hypothetical protein
MRPELTLGELLQRVHEQPWDQCIYAPLGAEFTATTPIVLLDPDEEERDEESDEIIYAQEWGLGYVLSVQDAQMVVENLTEQTFQPSLEDRLRAFRFYREHDAYIDLSTEHA